MSYKITLHSFSKRELDERVKDREKSGFKLKYTGVEQPGGHAPVPKYWAVMVK